jgi:hypothetical protein
MYFNMLQATILKQFQAKSKTHLKTAECVHVKPNKNMEIQSCLLEIGFFPISLSHADIKFIFPSKL